MIPFYVVLIYTVSQRIMRSWKQTEKAVRRRHTLSRNIFQGPFVLRTFHPKLTLRVIINIVCLHLKHSLN